MYHQLAGPKRVGLVLTLGLFIFSWVVLSAVLTLGFRAEPGQLLAKALTVSPSSILRELQSGQTVAAPLQVTQTTTDLIFDSFRQSLYATTPPNAPANPNSVVVINSVTAAVTKVIPVGNNPTKLALSDDGQFLYIALKDSGSVRRYDLNSQSLGPEFTISLGGELPASADDLEVLPGQPTSVAVSWTNSNGGKGVTIFDGTGQRPNRVMGSLPNDLLEFGANASALYGFNITNTENGFRKLAVDGNGVTVVHTDANALGGSVREFVFHSGLIYGTTGRIHNPETRLPVGQFPTRSSPTVAVDGPRQRAYFIGTPADNRLVLEAYDLNSFHQVASLELQGVAGAAGLTLSGPNTLAFRDATKVFLIPIADLVPVPPAPLPTPTFEANGVIKLNLPTSDVIFDPGAQKMYASVPGSAVGYGNSVVPIDLAGNPGTPIFVGSDPDRLAISGDNQYLYAGLNGAAAVRRVHLGSQSAGLQFSLGSSTRGAGPLSALDIAVQPGNPGVVVVTERNNAGGFNNLEGIAAYADGVKLPNSLPSLAFPSAVIEFSGSPGVLYGYGIISTNHKFAVDGSGITLLNQFRGVLLGANDIDYDNGRIYGSNGQVIDPEGQTLIGAYPASGPVLPDSGANRVYFVSSGNGVATVLAFDQQTYRPVGFLNIPISGFPTRLIHCGANALAFRTTGNQLFIVPLSSLQPYQPPAPVLTVRPDGVKQLTLPANDLLYNPHDQLVYASVPSVAGSIGNSITPFDPQTGAVQPSVFIGSEPYNLAISDSGDTIYAGLDGSAAVRRFDVSTKSPGLQFGLGNVSPTNDLRFADELAVAPGNSNLVAVSTFRLGSIPSSAGIGLFDNGIERSGKANGDTVAVSGSHLYSYSNQTSEFGVRKLAITSSGLSQLGLAQNAISGFGSRMVSAGGLLFGSDGAVVDPDSLALLGRFTRGDPGIWIAADPANNRVYFLSYGLGTALKLTAYDPRNFLQVGEVTLQNIRPVDANVIKFIRYGANGLAFNTTDGKIFLLSTSLIQPLSNTPIPTPVQVTGEIKRLTLATRDLIYSPNDGMIYAALPSRTDGQIAPVSFGNSLVAINPETATLGQPFFTGSEPSKLSISGDGQFIYMGFSAAESVARMRVSTRAVDFRFSLAKGPTSITPRLVQDMEVAPGSTDTLAILRSSAVEIYDSGVPRPITTESLSAFDVTTVIDYSNLPTRLYGYNGYSSSFDFHQMNVNTSGVQIVNNVRNLIDGFGAEFEFDNGRIYTTRGQAIDPELLTVVGTFPGSFSSPVNGLVVPESSSGRVFYLVDNHNGTATIHSYDRQTFVLLGSLTIPGVNGSPRSFIRWSTDGFAFRTTLNQLFIIRSATLVGPGAVQLGSVSYNVSENNQRVDITLTRSGNMSGPAQVTFTTNDGAGLQNCNVINGIASSRCDYAAAVRTISFAAGEGSKTFSIPIVDDSFAEGNEVFTVGLSSPTGASLGLQSSASVTITDNETTNGANPIEQTAFFVRQHYIDFLGREPDPGGFQGWQDTINNCPQGNTTCDRVHVSGNFFQSPEFQQRGYFVYRFYPVAFGRKPDYAEFIPDLARVSGFLSDAQLEEARLAFVIDFMSRPSFATTYNGLSNTQYVDSLLSTAGVTSANRNFWIAALGNGTRTRAQVLREIAESTEVYNKYFNQAFVVMQYFGYLRRDPDASYLNWIQELDTTGNSRNMINGFVNSLEYRFRFGP